MIHGAKNLTTIIVFNSIFDSCLNVFFHNSPFPLQESLFVFNVSYLNDFLLSASYSKQWFLEHSIAKKKCHENKLLHNFRCLHKTRFGLTTVQIPENSLANVCRSFCFCFELIQWSRITSLKAYSTKNISSFKFPSLPNFSEKLLPSDCFCETWYCICPTQPNRNLQTKHFVGN